jgi:hypothetical protein
VGNITAAEQIIFLTESLRARETLNRVLQDRMSTELLTHIINQHRTCPKYPVKANSVCKILQFTMQDENEEKWTVGKHKKGLIKGEKKWPEDKMTLADLDVNCETKHPKRNPPIDNIPFEAIAVDVTRLPSGDDALDLTHCLTWVLNNPGSGLLWPRDFEWLTEKLGGAQPVAAVNRDKAVFERWATKLKAYKKAKRVLKSNATKAEASMQTLKTKQAMLRATAKYEEASAALGALAQAPPALVSAVNGGILINTALIPPLVSGPDAATVAEYLAQFNAASVHNPPSVDDGLTPDTLAGPHTPEDINDDPSMPPKHDVSGNHVFDPFAAVVYDSMSLPAYHENTAGPVPDDFYTVGRPLDYGLYDFDQPFDPIAIGLAPLYGPGN